MKPLTLAMTKMLRQMRAVDRTPDAMKHLHSGVLMGLVHRGLAVPWLAGGVLTPEGRRVAQALGTLPAPSPIDEFCPTCDQYLPADLMAWDHYSWTSDRGVELECINCHLSRKGQAA